ncbi:MAG: 1-acyl-sn-glycerol-3-phosphate acyltransferase [Candidatus Melainabacteria bacterium]|nr:1-acyl-sn-glycerol-3-phosphate acyltransferase [Candidatus Melainabacteria bacterium]
MKRALVLRTSNSFGKGRSIGQSQYKQENWAKLCSPFFGVPFVDIRSEPQTKILFEELRAVPAIVCPNHCRHEDGELLFLISILIRQQFKFLAAQEMFSSYLGLGGYVLRQIGCFAVNRGGENPDTVRATEQQLTVSGGKVVIFPEGEIGYDNDHLEPLEPGAVVIALDAYLRLQHQQQSREVCIVPLAISYQFDDTEKVCGELVARLESKLALTPLAVSLFARTKRISEVYLERREQALGLAGAHSSQAHMIVAGPEIALNERFAKVFQVSMQNLAELLEYKIPAGSERHQLHHLQACIFAKGKKASWFEKGKFKKLHNETLNLNRLRSIKSDEFAETSSLPSLADLLCNLDVLITGRPAPEASQTVVISAAEPIRIGAYAEQYRQEREPTIELIKEQLRVSLQDKLQQMRATQSLSDLGGSSLTLRNNM